MLIKNLINHKVVLLLPVLVNTTTCSRFCWAAQHIRWNDLRPQKMQRWKTC